MFSRAKLGLYALLLLAAGSWLLLQFLNESNKEENATPFTGGVDYYLNNAVIEQLNNNGELLYKLSADRAEHYPADNRIELKQVSLSYVADNSDSSNTTWLLNSKTGVILEKKLGNIIILKDKVKLTQPYAVKAIDLVTESIEFNSANSTIRSTDKVIVKQGRHKIAANGLLADLNKNLVTLTGKVKGHYAGAKQP